MSDEFVKADGLHLTGDATIDTIGWRYYDGGFTERLSVLRRVADEHTIEVHVSDTPATLTLIEARQLGQWLLDNTGAWPVGCREDTR